jgi:type VI secretion system protein ImpK
MDTRRRPAFSVFEQFRSFWKEVDTLRAAALAPAMAPAGAPSTSTGLVPASSAARDRLLMTVRIQQADLARWASGAVHEYYTQALYVMIAVADEVFVGLPWSGAAHWRANLLETELFGTRSAGQSVFLRIDQMLERADPKDAELAAVYLTALALGFRGRYGDRADGGALDRYKQQLYRFIFNKRPDLSDPVRKLLPQCYENTVTSGTGRKLRSPRLWWWAAAAVVVVWLIAAQIVWMNLTSPVHDRMRLIEAQIQRLHELPVP